MEDKVWEYWCNLSKEEKANRLAKGLDVAELCKEALSNAQFNIMLANFQLCRLSNNFDDCVFIKICDMFKVKYDLSRLPKFDAPDDIDMFED